MKSSGALLKQKIVTFAKSLGFDLIKIAPATLEGKYVDALEKWLKKGFEAKMTYMQKSKVLTDPREILPEARTVICLALNYFYKQPALRKNHGRVARYSYGRDYHKVISKKLKQMEAYIQSLTVTAKTKSYVDAGPILERAFAEMSGIGFVGKNATLITEKYGSFVFLASVITNLDLPLDEKTLKTSKNFAGCGGCRKCIDSCPTGAIVAPGVIDSRKCIAYLTIENRQHIPKKFHAALKKVQTLFGCDICQEVCPHNRKAIPTSLGAFKPKIAGDQIDLKKILNIKSDDEFLKIFAGSPIMRAKYRGLLRNARILTEA